MKRRPLPTNRSSDVPVPAPPDSGVAVRCAESPTPRTMTLLSLFLVFHLLAISLSFFSVVDPSETQVRLLSLVQPYLRATRFGVDDRPIYLTHADRSEQPMRLQVAKTFKPSEQDWRTIHPPGVPGLASSDRHHRWLATAVLLAESDQPGLVAELLLGFASDQPDIRSLRIVRLPTELTTILDDAAPPPYVARVARAGDRVSFVHVPSAAHSSVAVPRAPDEPR